MTPNPTAHRSPAKLMKRLAAFLVALLWLWSAGFLAATAQSMAVGLLAFAAYPRSQTGPPPRRPELGLPISLSAQPSPPIPDEESVQTDFRCARQPAKA